MSPGTSHWPVCCASCAFQAAPLEIRSVRSSEKKKKNITACCYCQGRARGQEEKKPEGWSPLIVKSMLLIKMHQSITFLLVLTEWWGTAFQKIQSVDERRSVGETAQAAKRWNKVWVRCFCSGRLVPLDVAWGCTAERKSLLSEFKGSTCCNAVRKAVKFLDSSFNLTFSHIFTQKMKPLSFHNGSTEEESQLFPSSVSKENLSLPWEIQVRLIWWKESVGLELWAAFGIHVLSNEADRKVGN